MNERQLRLLGNLRVEAHLARALDIKASAFYNKLYAVKSGKAPVLKVSQQNSFEVAYKEKLVEFWSDLAVIAAKNLKELE